MALMTWSCKYSVGVEALDNQHKSLMSALNELRAASMRGNAQEIAGPRIRQLVSIAHEHFSAKERLMVSIRFSGLAAHLAKHQELTGKLVKFVARHEKRDTTVYTQLLYFIRDWLTQHLQTEGQEFARRLSLRGVH